MSWIRKAGQRAGTPIAGPRTDVDANVIREPVGAALPAFARQIVPSVSGQVKQCRRVLYQRREIPLPRLLQKGNALDPPRPPNGALPAYSDAFPTVTHSLQ